MNSEFNFSNWVNKQGVSRNTISLISHIRNSPPARNVGNKKSVSGKFPSKKMGCYIQFESNTVELPAIYLMDQDDDVYEYYDQPNQIKLSYSDQSGRLRAFNYTPDFFKITRDGAGWEEWKTEEELIRLSTEKPWRYSKDENGQWICPPAENFAKEYGCFFKVRSDKEINWTLHRNLIFLDSYYRHLDKLSIEDGSLKFIRNSIMENKFIKLSTLLERCLGNEISSDKVFIALLFDEIYIDITKQNLVDSKEVIVYLTKDDAITYQNINNSMDLEQKNLSCNPINIVPGQHVSWDGVKWQIINAGTSKISLLSKSKVISFDLDEFYLLLNKNEIFLESDDIGEDNIEDRINEILKEASYEDLATANSRVGPVKAYIEGKYNEEDFDHKVRTVKEWAKKYRNAQKKYSNGYVGLLPQTKKRGNRSSRLDSRVSEMMEKFIAEEYETIVQKNIISVYADYKNQCEEIGLIAASYPTFCKKVEERPKVESVRKRKGSRAAYQQKEFYWELHKKVPRHGEFAFNICHLDHTELDIELVSSTTGKNLGRPYLSLMTDAFTRKIIAFYITFEDPSYRSCMMVLRDCVKRNNRFPQALVVDNGKEFHSIYFESLLAMYECEIKRRPSAKPRNGSVLERLFGATNTRFINNLEGNTQIMKNVREVTKSVNPKSHAVWTVSDIYRGLEHFFFEIYNNLTHPSLGETPNEAFRNSLAFKGERKQNFIKYSKNFEIMTLPSTQKGEATVQPSLGIKVNYIYYWNEKFKNPQYEKQKFKVRFDPFDMGKAYVYIGGVWLTCISQYYSVFNGMSQKELNFLTTEIKKANKEIGKNTIINAQKIASFLREFKDSGEYQKVKNKADEVTGVYRSNNVPNVPNLSDVVGGLEQDEKPVEESNIPPENKVSKENNQLNLQLYEEF